ncbi:MAG: YbaK/EbsC family protein [Dehalococcoidia bacterium]|nr:YbaK/EbsC family protein [Dehalococcoidia bacterium]
MTPNERVRAALEALGLPAAITSYDGSTHTAADAAAPVGCEPGQIVKSLFFVAEGRPTLALVAGDRQVDTAKLAEIVGVGRKKLKMGTPEEVIAQTGFPVGGVPPVGLARAADVVVDESLRRFRVVWASAGTDTTVFEADTLALVQAVNGQWAGITRDAS